MPQELYIAQCNFSPRASNRLSTLLGFSEDNCFEAWGLRKWRVVKLNLIAISNRLRRYQYVQML